MTENPYKTPIASAELQRQPNTSASLILGVAKPIFIKWELLRIAYCLICLIGVLVSMSVCNRFPSGLFIDRQVDPALLGWESYILYGLIANVCFFAGPIVETYVTWLGFKHRVVWIACFVLGTVATLFAAHSAVIGF